MKPFYQGKLDVFCALYAVINALQITHGIRTLKGRDILNDTLLHLATDNARFSMILHQETDYSEIIDEMLLQQSQEYPLHSESPFVSAPAPYPTQFWNACKNWMEAGDQRTILFRFFRYLFPHTEPINRHWTTLASLDEHALYLFDCSNEPEAISCIQRNAFSTRQEEKDEHLIYIQPESVRFVTRV